MIKTPYEAKNKANVFNYINKSKFFNLKKPITVTIFWQGYAASSAGVGGIYFQRGTDIMDYSKRRMDHERERDSQPGP